MSFAYKCPKCSGEDVYFNKKQVITGIGGIYGNRQKEVERPFCRKCDIEANQIVIGEDGKVIPQEQIARNQRKFLLGCGFIVVLIPLVLDFLNEFVYKPIAFPGHAPELFDLFIFSFFGL